MYNVRGNLYGREDDEAEISRKLNEMGGSSIRDTLSIPLCERAKLFHVKHEARKRKGAQENERLRHAVFDIKGRGQ